MSWGTYIFSKPEAPCESCSTHVGALVCIAEHMLSVNLGVREPPPITSSAPTKLIHGIDVGVAGNELFHHALHRQAGCQDQCSRAIRHAGIQVSGAVPDENLKKSQCRTSCRSRGTHSTLGAPNLTALGPMSYRYLLAYNGVIFLLIPL